SLFSFFYFFLFYFFFFFSSRRRHTRFSRDWSSDVCSSDLPDQKKPMMTFFFRHTIFPRSKEKTYSINSNSNSSRRMVSPCLAPLSLNASSTPIDLNRSEEHTSELQSREISYAVFCLTKREI